MRAESQISQFIYRGILLIGLFGLFGCSEESTESGVSIEGKYQNESGNVGIYKMDYMTIKKIEDNSYQVDFSGSERNLSYANGELEGSVLRVSDKGIPWAIEFENGKAKIFLVDLAIFKKIE